MPNKQIKTQIQSLLSTADSLLITAGAGMGVDSGLPDFRGNVGMWQAYPALAKVQMDFTQIANPQAFLDSPTVAWGFYGHRLQLYRKTMPHQGFARLLDIAKHLGLPYFVFTSNVDGQFTKAGFDPKRIYECHGSIHHLQCMNNCCDDIWSADTLNPVIDETLCQWLGDLPKCPNCSGLARPNILMFGDYSWQSWRSDEQESRLQHFLRNQQNSVVIEIGAGIAVPTVRRFGECFAPNLIRINPKDGLSSTQGVYLPMTAALGIELIWQSIQ